MPWSESRGAGTLAILAYHQIGKPPEPWDSWYYIPEQTLAEQLRYLADHGWRVLDHRSLLEGLHYPEQFPERAAVLTFDDGHRSFREHALPWLIRFDFPAVLFVPTDYIGGLNSFDDGAEPEAPICGWDDLRELDRHSVAIQSHSVSHRAFSKLASELQEQELRRSKEVLEDGLGKPVETFSFPFGDDGGSASSRIGELLRRVGYRAACLYGHELNPLPVRNPYRLERLTMGPETDLSSLLGEAVGKRRRRPTSRLR